MKTSKLIKKVVVGIASMAMATVICTGIATSTGFIGDSVSASDLQGVTLDDIEKARNMNFKTGVWLAIDDECQVISAFKFTNDKKNCIYHDCDGNEVTFNYVVNSDGYTFLFDEDSDFKDTKFTAVFYSKFNAVLNTFDENGNINGTFKLCYICKNFEDLNIDLNGGKKYIKDWAKVQKIKKGLWIKSGSVIDSAFYFTGEKIGDEYEAYYIVTDNGRFTNCSENVCKCFYKIESPIYTFDFKDRDEIYDALVEFYYDEEKDCELIDIYWEGKDKDYWEYDYVGDMTVEEYMNSEEYIKYLKTL